MSLRLDSSLTARTVQRHLSSASTGALARSYARVASGLRVATAADDAAGLAISERMRARVRSLDAAARNSADALGYVRTSDAGLAGISDLLVRLRELAVQAASGTLSGEDRGVTDLEFQGLVQELDQLSGLEFNGHALLDNTDAVEFQVSAGKALPVTLDNVDVRASTLGLTAHAVTSASSAGSALIAIDKAVVKVAGYRGARGAAESRLLSAHETALSARENLTAAESRIRDADLAHETAQLARLQILQSGGTALLAQARVSSDAALQLLRAI
ncbi:MAG: flagellin FliC [Planctomycetes bacterium]|nr:flagellin FliC [Planctomycetota bacterium]